MAKLQTLLSLISKKLYYCYKNENKSRKKCSKAKSALSYYGLSQKGRTRGSFSTSALKRRTKFIDKCLNYHNSCVVDSIDFTSHFLIKSVSKNVTATSVLSNKIWANKIRDLNICFKSVKKSEEHTKHVALMGILHKWSERDFKKIHDTVCNLCVITRIYAFIWAVMVLDL